MDRWGLLTAQRRRLVGAVDAVPLAVAFLVPGDALVVAPELRLVADHICIAGG